MVTFQPPMASGKFRASLLATSLMVGLLACSSNPQGQTPTLNKPPSAPAQSPTPTPKPTATSTVAETEFKSHAIALKATAESEGQGFSDLKNFQLPDNVDISQISVVEASLDGRKLSPDDVSLGTDDDGSIVFFLSEDAINNQLLSLGDDVSVSIHSAGIFAEKIDTLRSSVLENYQAQVHEDVDEQIPTPSFLATEVRGNSLTRQEVAVLKKDAGKLAKEGVFIDRNFYCVLSVNDQAFSVQQATPENQLRHLISKFTLPGDQVKKIAAALKEPRPDGEVLQLPSVAEHISQSDRQFFHPLDNLDDAVKVIEIEEIEESLELELGAELAPKGVPFDEVELPLDLHDLDDLEQRHPNLARRPLAEAQDDHREDLGTALAEAQKRALDVDTTFQRLGLHPIPDARLFLPGQIRPPRFGQVPLRRPTGAFHIPPHLLPPPPSTEHENPSLPDGTCPPPPPGPNGEPIPAPTPLANGNCPLASAPPSPPPGVPKPPPPLRRLPPPPPALGT